MQYPCQKTWHDPCFTGYSKKCINKHKNAIWCINASNVQMHWGGVKVA
ncbi:hypothetical protein VPHD254_0212 [Vibrio phage D254]